MSKLNLSEENYFPELDFEIFNIPQLGYFPVNISVFDHWLDSKEAEASKIMTYSIALESSQIDSYLKGEAKFVEIYKYLASEGVFAKQNEKIVFFDKVNSNFEKIITESLREKKLMDIYFVGINARVIGGYDRTDLFLLNDKKLLPDLRDLVNKVGLYILNSSNQSA